MHVFLLGNGFDINHGLPTKYLNFLRTMNYLLKHYNSDMNTIGKVFCSEYFIENDCDIANSYKLYSNVYDSVSLDADKIQSLIKAARENVWYQYFSNQLTRDIKWIDFEREIATVLEVLGKHLPMITPQFYFYGKEWSKVDLFIFKKFDFYYYETNEQSAIVGYNNKFCVNKEFVYEYPLKSKLYKVNVSLIIEELYHQLQDFSKILKGYFECFVDAFTKELSTKQSACIKNNLFVQAEAVFTFNYTRTFENLYSSRLEIHHIHGSTDCDIVLGTNPDLHDELPDLDTSFIQFKKYYQRVFYKTDTSYLSGIEDLRKIKRREKNRHVLHVVGHSLDITDKDLIQEIFDSAGSIFIYYHNESAIGSYIKNLISIYGKSGFDTIRKEKALMFLPLSNQY